MKTTKHREEAGPIALVTGANRGLGFEIARQLLAPGLRVVLTGRDEAATRRALEALGAAGKNAIAVRLDVTDSTSIAAARRTAEEQLGPVEQGADTAVWLATLPENGPTGRFFRDRRGIP